MRIRLYLACARGLRPMLEAKLQPGQEQAQNKNLYIFFLVVVSLFTSTFFPLCHFLSLILDTALSHLPGDIILNGHLFYSATSEVNCIFAFFYSDYYDFFGFNIHSFVPHIFCHNQFYRSR